MNWKNFERSALNENLLKTLIKVSKSDGSVHDNELVYILKVGKALGISNDTIKELWSEKQEKLFIPTSEQDRMTILYYLIFVIEADKKLDEKEENIIYHYGLKLGFNHLMIDDFLNAIRAKLKNEIEVLDLLKEVKKYLN